MSYSRFIFFPTRKIMRPIIPRSWRRWRWWWNSDDEIVLLTSRRFFILLLVPFPCRHDENFHIIVIILIFDAATVVKLCLLLSQYFCRVVHLREDGVVMGMTRRRAWPGTRTIARDTGGRIGRRDHHAKRGVWWAGSWSSSGGRRGGGGCSRRRSSSRCGPLKSRVQKTKDSSRSAAGVDEGQILRGGRRVVGVVVTAAWWGGAAVTGLLK